MKYNGRWYYNTKETGRYGDYEAAVGIDGELLAGSLPKKQLKMVVGWLTFHEEEAYKAWNQAVRGEHFDKIATM